MNENKINDLLKILKQRDEEIKDLYKEIHETQQANINLSKSYNDLKHEIAIHQYNNLIRK